MKLIIDIDEKDYNLAYDLINGVYPTTYQARIYKAIANGTPYNPTGDLISRKALREDLRRSFPSEVLEGIEPKTLFAQIIHDIDNAPSVEVRDNFDLGYIQGLEDGKEKSDHAL